MTATFISAGNGQPLICLHGIGSTGKAWQAQVDYFSKDYLCIGLDLPGYGGTPSLDDNNFEALSHWLKQTLDENGWNNPILVGNSYGGMIIQEFIYFYPGLIKAAVLFGTSPAFGKKDGEWQQNYIRARLEPFEQGKTMADMVPEMIKGLTGSNATAEGLASAAEDIVRVSEETFCTSVVTLLQFDRRKNLGNIDVPTLLLVGSEDRNAPPKMMANTATYIPNSIFVEMKGLGHIAHIENPAVFNAALEAFLRTL
ncbi:MAG: alpha/beta hydrolase [Chloroflexota bacterium]